MNEGYLLVAFVVYLAEGTNRLLKWVEWISCDNFKTVWQGKLTINALI